MELGLEDKAALVTGASQGIGMAIARKLAEEGARVATCARTEDDVADAVCFLVSERATCINGAALVVDGSKFVVI